MTVHFFNRDDIDDKADLGNCDSNGDTTGI